MTIGELIKELAKYDFDAKVETACENCGDYNREINVKEVKNTSSVELIFVYTEPY